MPTDSPPIPPIPWGSFFWVRVCALRAVCVVLGLVAWHWTQGLLGARPAPADGQQWAALGAGLTRADGLLQLTAPVNDYLRDNRDAAHDLLVVSSAMIDLLGIFLLGWSVFGASLRPFIGLLALFGLRQITQVLCALPPPEGMIWEYPGFPSLLVTYNVANDFFFSGHTAIAVFGVIELGRFARQRLRAWGFPRDVIAITDAKACLMGAFLIAVVILLRAHYTMDVFAGVLAAVLGAIFANRVAPRCDAVVCQIVGGRQLATQA
jgi:hypothetical protein